MDQNEKLEKIEAAVQDRDLSRVAVLVVEMVLDAEEDVTEIAADFVENEVGRFDWVRNWEVIKEKEDPVAKVQHYLLTYGLMADAREVVNIIDQMARTNPGHWK